MWRANPIGNGSSDYLTSLSILHSHTHKRKSLKSKTKPIVMSSSPAAAAAVTTKTQSMDSMYTCRYPSKKCWNSRALKRNGEMHNLCDLHRQKANKNQRRLEQKRKIKKIAPAKRTRQSRKKKQLAATTAIAAMKAHATLPTIVIPTAAPRFAKQAPSAVPAAPAQLPVRVNSLPAGFFTDIMLSENLFMKQLGVFDLNVPQIAPLPLQQQVNVTADFLSSELDHLTDCLDAIPSLAAMLGNASPIDVCEEIDGMAVTGSEFWSYPFGNSADIPVDSTLLLNDEVFSFQQ